jgi:hypothetical protein
VWVLAILLPIEFGRSIERRSPLRFELRGLLSELGRTAQAGSNELIERIKLLLQKWSLSDEECAIAFQMEKDGLRALEKQKSGNKATYTPATPSDLW